MTIARFNGGSMDGETLAIEHDSPRLTFPVVYSYGVITNEIYTRCGALNDGTVEYVYTPTFSDMGE